MGRFKVATLDEIQNGLENTKATIQPNPIPEDEYGIIKQELFDLRNSIESILIWMKITNRLSEAQYNFVFGHISETKKQEDEDLNTFLTRSAIELEKKMKNAGLI
jgi:hypothetical protein